MKSASSNRFVVVTGASSGLGYAATVRLVAEGFHVLACVRSKTGANILESIGGHSITSIIMDITVDSDIDRACRRIADHARSDGLFGLVNNAGTCIYSPLEWIPPAEFTRQLQTNLIGPHSLTRGLLPQLRRRGQHGSDPGRIINISSGAGKIAPPYMGSYAASKFALEAMSDSLRRELYTQGIKVSIVEPGAVATPIWDKVGNAADNLRRQASDDVSRLYEHNFERFLRSNETAGMGSKTRPEQFAEAVVHALTSRTPKIRYRVGKEPWFATMASRLLPDNVLDRFVRTW